MLMQFSRKYPEILDYGKRHNVCQMQKADLFLAVEVLERNHVW